MITIIIPTYNRKVLLKKCINSLINQSYKDFEIIVVDDGSTDGTKDLIKNYEQIRYLRQENKGPGNARNLGIKNAGGSIIAFTDDDCIPDKDWLKNALHYFDDPAVIGVEGKTLKKGKLTPTSIPIINEYGGKYSTCNMFYRLSLLKEIGGFDKRFRFSGEDSNLARRALKKGKIVFAKDVKVVHPVKYYDIKGFIKKHKSLKKTYWQVLGSKESKKYFSWESLVHYPFYISLIILLFFPNIFTLILFLYAYITDILIYDLYLTKARIIDVMRYKKTLIKLVFVWWIIIFLDCFFRIWGILRFKRVIL